VWRFEGAPLAGWGPEEGVSKDWSELETKGW
jgi:hypothetical protein